MAELKETVDLSSDKSKMDLYSRQIDALGLDLMGKLVQMKVLIVGLKGVGVETAKNLILAGPKAVAIHDDEPVKIEDLGTNFYVSEKDVGKPRASVCLSQLATLNPYVDVSVLTGKLDASVWKDFSAIVYTSATTPLAELIACDNFCRTSVPYKPFVYGATMGVTSTIFSDFGPGHKINDPNGEPTKVNIVEDIDATGLVTLATEKFHGMDDGDYVRFEEVTGMTELNSLKDPIPIKRVYRKSKTGSAVVANKIQLDIDVSSFGKYTGGGICNQVNVPKIHVYKSLEASLINPLSEGDWALPHMQMSKMLEKNQSAQLHFAKLAVWRFQSKTGRLPELHSLKEANEVVDLAKAILAEHKEATGGALVVDTLDEDIIRKTALYARAELTGFAAFLGGVLAQEVVKLGGKFTPIKQWLHHDAFELLGDTVPADAASIGSRYDWQINIFGRAFQEKLFDQKWFLVGAGALGCEYIKGIALMGIGARRGLIHLTDMDRIEVSNLNRQFLFRKENVGSPKSLCAANAAKKMNPEIIISTTEIPVGPDTEDKFDDDFWSSLDGVWNALDNIKARRYTDSKCVFFEKPLLESGTLGTKANSEIILPKMTTCYSDHKEAEEDAIPMCTLRNFPHFIEHCIEWARAQFTELFADSAQDYNSLIRDVDAFYDQVTKEGSIPAQLDKLESVKKVYDLVKGGVTLDTCVQLALNEFIKQYRDRILDLTHVFPKDSRKIDPETKEDLGLFWSGEKRFPQGAVFDAENELHLDYVFNTANLFAVMFGVPVNRDHGAVKDIAKKLSKSIPDWKPKAGLKIDLGDGKEEKKAAPEASDEEADKLNNLKKFFKSEDLKKLKTLLAADFEKDDDTNFHIDFITACSNLRAWNYSIKLATRHKCKAISGKIIPALATTTAMITGLVELEFYKVVLKKDITKFCNANVNLAVSSFQAFEPIEPNKEKPEIDPVMGNEVKPLPDAWTVWDKVVVKKGNLTVEEFVKALAEVHHGIKTELLLKYGITQKQIDEGKGQPLYNAGYLPPSLKAKQEANFKRNLIELYVETYGPLPSSKAKFVLLDGEFTDKDDNPVKIPKLVYYFK